MNNKEKAEFKKSMIILITSFILIFGTFLGAYLARTHKNKSDIKVSSTPENTISNIYEAFTKKDYGEIFDNFYIGKDLNYSKEKFVNDMTELENTGFANSSLISGLNITLPPKDNSSEEPKPISIDDLTKTLDISVVNIGKENTVSNVTTCNVLIKVRLYKILSTSGEIKAVKEEGKWKIDLESVGDFITKLLDN